MSKVVIFGVGEIAEVAHIYLQHDSDHEVVAFTVDREYKNQDEFRSLPVVSFEDLIETYPTSEYKLFIPISFRDLNKHRSNKFKQAKELGFQMISFISSKAQIMPETEIGENCFIGAGATVIHGITIADGAVIGAGVTIKNNVSSDEVIKR